MIRNSSLLLRLAASFALGASLLFSVVAPPVQGLVGQALAADDHHDNGPGEHGHEEHADDGHADEGHDEPAKGPHGGRLLEEGDFAVEVSIFETGVEPQMRVYFSRRGEVLDPARATLEVTLHRLGRAPEKIRFEPRGDFLLGDHTIEEPHSYEVDVSARWGEDSLKAHYDSFEARVTLTPEIAAVGGVTQAVASARSLDRTRRLTGRVGIASDRMAELHPRYPGVVVRAQGRIGEPVAAGSSLATMESSATLSSFSVQAPFAGVILDRRAVVGASFAVDDVLYVVADLSEVWADFDLYGTDTAVVRAGEVITIHDDSGKPGTVARVTYISPLRDVHTQTTLARAVLANDDGRWAPGAFLSGIISIDEEPAAVAVPVSALQPWRGRDALFIHSDGIWEARPVRIGRRGEEWVEILDGLDAGTAVATGNTFLLRAEIEKVGASHDH